MKKIAKPQIAVVDTWNPENSIETESRYENYVFENVTLDFDVSGVRFYECEFHHVTFTGSCEQSEFVDVIFDHCVLNNLNVSQSHFRRTEFDHDRLLGLTATECNFNDTRFMECDCDYADFGGTLWKLCEIRSCRARESSFTMNTFHNMQFKACDLSGSEWLNTDLDGLDFSDSEITGITVNPENLKGLTISEYQAVGMIQLLGLRVRN